MKLEELLNSNTEKMHFQQNMCFQMKNWSTVLTIGIIGLIWQIRVDDYKAVSIAIHFPIIFFLWYTLYEVKKWMRYYIVFKDRVIEIEDLLTKGKKKVKNFPNIYYKYHKNQLCHEELDYFKINNAAKKEKLDNKENLFYFLLISLTVISLVGKILCYYEIIICTN